MAKFFNSNLNYLRKIKKITQQELANKTGIERSTISRIENGDIETSIENAIKISKVFNIPLEVALSRDLRVSDTNDQDNNFIRIPILGVIPAGIPFEAIENVLGYEDIPIDWLRGGKEYFGLLIKGDSMSPKYLDGDIVIFTKQEDFENGDECAVMVNGDDATFKKILKHDRGITLQPLNSNYDIKYYTDEDVSKLPIKVIGVAKELRRKLWKI